MTNEDFNQFLNHFKKQAFADDKVKLFKTKNISTAFTSKQISQLLKEIPFDKDKLPLAKAAFIHCIDPENYYLVVDILDFSLNKDELEDFISKHFPEY